MTSTAASSLRPFPSANSIPAIVRRRAEIAPDAVALESREEVISYRQLLKYCEQVDRQLKSVGIERSDRVAVVLPNGPLLAMAFLAIAAQAACAPLNPAYTRAELEFYLADLEAAALVTASSVDSTARELATKLGLPVLELQLREEADGGENNQDPDPDDVALILHTSGTTARPKIVPLSHRNLCASARNVASTLTLSEDDRCLNVMPLFHIHGLVAGVLASLWAGGTVICAPDFQAPSFLMWLKELSPTWYTAVPTLHQAVLARVERDGELPVRTRLRVVRSSSAPLPPMVMAKLEEAFGVPVIESYGMTEAAHQMTSNPLPPAVRKPGSVGTAAGPEVVILNDAGDMMAPGEVGEVAIRGENVFGGYGGSDDANERAFTHGWFRTGDEGSFDDDGYLFLSGRLKEIINRGGEKVSPREVDEVLLAHPAVAQAVTFAVPDPRLGEEVGAAVVLRDGAWVSERDLQAFAAISVADFKVPRSITFVSEIPRGPSGKLQRIGLAEVLGIAPQESVARQEVKPRTKLERELAALWAEVLGVERVGVADEFFTLGGDSILAAELVARLRADYHRPTLPLTILVWAPTVERLAAELATGSTAERSNLVVPLRAEGVTPPLFFVHGLGREVVSFGALAHRLGPRQPFYGIRARGVVDGERPHEGVEEMVADYLAGVRAVQPHGPYYLGGLCMGAPIALEMARRLKAAGEQVRFLALLDPRVPPRRGLTYYFWQARLAWRKVLMGDYSWRLASPRRQREILSAPERVLRRLHLLPDRRDPADRALDDRMREIRNDLTAGVYDGDVHIYVSLDWPLRAWFWKPLIEGRLELEDIPSRHVPLLRPPAVDILADRLGRALRAAQAARAEE